MYQLVADLAQPYVLSVLLTGLALANLWRKRVESRRRLLLVAVPFLGLWVLSTPAIGYLALGSLEWQQPPLEAMPRDAEAIVVLSGYVWPPNEVRREPELDGATLYRCLRAVQLHRQAPSCPIVVSGGKVDPDEPGPTLAKAMHDFLLTQGVAPSAVQMEDRSRTTYENALYTAELLQARGTQKIVLVTSATHLPRAVRCFQAQGLVVVPAGSEYRATGFDWRLTDFLPRPSAARDTQTALHEWLGMLWYWGHGRI